MVLQDTLANALSVISNSERLGKTTCHIKPISNMIKSVLTMMKDQLFLGEFEEVEDGRGNYLKINLLGRINQCGVIKPRLAVTYQGFEKFEKRYLPAKGFGFLLISTSSGIMTQEEAITKKLGGRLMMYVY